MNQLDRLEALAQRLIEGTFSRLFQTKLHPSDLARHLTIAIENGCRNGSLAQAGLIPNRYEIRLNPADYSTLMAGSGYQVELAELYSYLLPLIREANYQLAGPLELHLDESETVPPGQVEIKCF